MKKALLVCAALALGYAGIHYGVIARNAIEVSHLHQGDYVTKRLIGKDQAVGQVVEVYQREQNSLREHPVQSCGFISKGEPFVIGASTISTFVSAPKSLKDWAHLSVRPETLCRVVVSVNFIDAGILYDAQHNNPNASPE